jgi:predicted permease
MQSDLDDEIRSHLEREIDDNIARGMTRDQAERAAYRKFGNRTRVKEDVWRLRPWAWLDGVRQDLVYALRMMRKNWGFTAIAVVSLALGIGGNTALFSLVDRLMLRTLPVREPERLVQLTATRRFAKESSPFFTYPNYEDLRALDFFDGVAGWNNRFAEVEWNGEKRNRLVTLVTGDYFPTLGVRPVIGRLLDTKDDSPAGGDAAVITYALWEREFQLSPSVLGQKFRWGLGLFTVVGVTPLAFQGVEIGTPPEKIFLSTHSLPLMGDKGKLKDAGSPNLLALMARLKPGVAREQIQSVLAERWPKMALARLAPPPAGFTSQLTLTPGYAGFSWLQRQFGYGLWILLGLSGIVLAAACANLASLQLLRADARRREMSIRAAAGATSGRIVRQWFTESLLLSAAGGLA